MRMRRLERKMLREVRREGRIKIPTSRRMLMNIPMRNRRQSRFDQELSIPDNLFRSEMMGEVVI